MYIGPANVLRAVSVRALHASVRKTCGFYEADVLVPAGEENYAVIV